MISSLIVKFAQIRSKRFVQLYLLQFSVVVLYYNQKEGNNKPDSKREDKDMRKISELTTEEYISVVIASGKVKDFKGWCKRHDVDYEDAMSYDWD